MSVITATVMLTMERGGAGVEAGRRVGGTSAGGSSAGGTSASDAEGARGERAALRGENSPTLDELLEVVVAPIYFRALFTTPMPAAESAHLVDRLLALTATRAA